MRGIIEHLTSRTPGERPTFGFIMGEDRVSYFFIPTAMQRLTRQFDDVQQGMTVEFIGIEHPKGPRAIEVRVIE